MLIKYTEAELRIEIEAEIRARLANRQPVHPAWLTHTICQRHRAGLAVDAEVTDVIEPEDVAFWRFGGYTITRKLATACINGLEADPGDETSAPTTPFLPGFKLLQPQYVVRRDEIDVMVPTEQMTDDEALAKAELYERNSVTLAEHARELRRYVALRAAHRQASGE
jgi:hypothetical protein